VADIEYMVPRKSKFRVTSRAIHKLVLMIPIEEQTMEDDWEMTEWREDDATEQESGEIPATILEIESS
jgi:hypothetical protein